MAMMTLPLVAMTSIDGHLTINGGDDHALVGERQEAQILKFDAHTHFVCHVHLIVNFLSFHMSLVVVVNYGAGNALRGFEISMFYFFSKTLFYTHIQRHTAAVGTKCY